MNFLNVVCIHKYYPGFTENKILSLATIWMNLKDTKGNKPGTKKTTFIISLNMWNLTNSRQS